MHIGLKQSALYAVIRPAGDAGHLWIPVELNGGLSQCKKSAKEEYVKPNEMLPSLVLSQNCQKRLLESSCLSIRLSALNNSPTNGGSFMKFDILSFYSKIFREN